MEEKTLDNFSLENFEGPLELLLFLIQKEEVDIADVTLQKLTEQFAQKEFEIDKGSEWLVITATLILLKSQKLIPGQTIDEEELPRIEVFQKLLEYCRFKEASEKLASQEEKQKLLFSRGASETPKRSATGLDEVDLKDLTLYLQEVIKRAPQTKTIEKDVWEVAPKIEWLREEVASRRVPLADIFHEKRCREELIVCFLALLELMKLEEVKLEGSYVESTRT